MMTGNVSYDPDNHDHMIQLRAQKMAGILGAHPRAEGGQPGRHLAARACMGDTYGRMQLGAHRLRKEGKNSRTRT